MKKIVLAAIAVVSFGFANAQDVKFGIKGAINLHTLTGDVDNASSKVGFQAGAFAEFKLSDKFAIQPELLYSTQGAKIEYSESEYDYNYNSKVRLGYLNIPVMAKFYIIDKLSVEAGPQIGFLLSAKSKYEETNGNEHYSETENVKDGFKSVDFGVNFGAAYDFTENLSLGARYNLGLTNISKDSDITKIKNSVFSLSIGYKF